jgi:tetrapyrrole methylase family protein/MazG family protein
MAKNDGHLSAEPAQSKPRMPVLPETFYPHVKMGKPFLKLKTGSAAEVLSNWEDIKNEQKKNGSKIKAVNMVAKSLPALMRTEKVQGRAARAGFDIQNTVNAADKVFKILSEINKRQRDPQDAQRLIGELLFTAVTIAKNFNIDPEEALNAETERFVKSFLEGEKQKKDKLR